MQFPPNPQRGHRRSLRDNKRELEQATQRIRKLDEIIQRLYEDNLEGKITDEEKAELEAKHNALAAILDAADRYDPDLHGFAEEGALAEAYAVAEALYMEYSDLSSAAATLNHSLSGNRRI